MALMSSPVTASSRSASGSTPAPTVNTPASPPSQPVSLPDNNALAHAISRALAESFLRCCLPSRFKWREHKHGRDGWSSLLGFDINAASGILKLRYSRPYPSIFRYACCALVYFNLQLIWKSFGCLYSPRHVLRQLACSGWGLLWWRDRK